MSLVRRAWLFCTGWIAWRLPGRGARLLSQFSQAERGSAYDMLAAAELTTSRALRRKYLEHALDEARHAGVFRGRALALGVSREEAALFDVSYLVDTGIVGGQTLFERLGELEFLAFVHVSEQRALEQFDVYQRRRLPDPATRELLAGITKDEIFHMTYTGAEVARLRGSGHEREVRRALRRITWRRYKERWLNLSRDLGSLVSGLWLALFYVVFIGPFRLLARGEREGWHPVEPAEGAPLDRARAMG